MSSQDETLTLKPQQGSQVAFLENSAQELLYGGEAGGGKSWCLIAEPLRWIGYKDFRFLIFRRTYPRLEPLIWEAIEMYKPFGAKYNESKKIFKFPSGAIGTFAHMQHVKDMYDFQGKQFDYIAFDEITHFAKVQYMYLWRSLRGLNPKIPRLMRATANPDGEGLLWVIARFIDPLKPGEIKRFVTLNDRDVALKDDEPGGTSRCFVQSFRQENRALMDNDPEYESRLDMLPEHIKRAHKYGSWDLYDQPFQLIKTKWWKDALNGNNKTKDGINALGCDYAETTDQCTICIGSGNQVQKFLEYPGMKTNHFADIIYKEHVMRGKGFTMTGVDSVGPGVGVYHNLAEQDRLGDRVFACEYKDINFDRMMKARHIDLQFDNWRTQAWWKFRDDMERGRIDLSPLQSEKGFYDGLHLLQEETLAHTYEIVNGKLKIVSKKILRDEEHLGRSPDRADALVIWNWVRGYGHVIGKQRSIGDADYGHHKKYEKKYVPNEAIAWT